MKTSLTAADPSGWYECSLLNDSSEFRAIIWDGKQMLLGTNRILGPYTNFRRLFTESDVAALNEELRTLREELATNKHSLDVCSKYAESMNRSSEDYLDELRKAREENATLQSQADSLLKQAEQLEAELSRLKSQPYVMRRADKPDCVGIWCDKEAEILTIEEPSELSFPFLHPPYFYLGPIPVVVEQQPPKVVRVWNKRTGRESLAIPQMRGNKPEYYLLLLADGTMGGERVWCNNWEEVQS